MRLRPTGIALAAVLAAPTWTSAAESKAKPQATTVQDASAKPPATQTAPAQAPDNVRITLQTVPARKAIVKWGKKNLGMIPAPRPLIVVRPRDSGPLDLVIRMTGYLPVHTRAYTFSDSRVAVKLTPVTEKNTLFGYREELPPEQDAGLPPDPGTPTQAPDAAKAAPPPATAQ